MKQKMRVGIYGGTFNPPHKAHIKSAEAFIEKMQLDCLYIVPSCVPPHKEYAGNVSAEDRFEMCRLAFLDIPHTVISDVEIKRGGKSYTYETLSFFKDENCEIFFLCGTDMFLTLDTWKCPAVIFDLSTICLIRRESEHENTVKISEKLLEYKEKFNARIEVLYSDVIELSSTYVREILPHGKLTDKYIPMSVINFINERGLYK